MIGGRFFDIIITMYAAISKNKRTTILLMFVFVLIIGSIGLIVGLYNSNYYISLAVFIGAIIYAAFQYFLAGSLAVATLGARQIEKKDAPELWRAVENLAITNGIPMPKVYIINDSAPNAFATGRDPKHAIVGVTSGLLDVMDKRELEAVLAHEIGHVINYDIRVSMIAFGLVSAIGLVADIALRGIMFSGNDDDRPGPVVLIVMAVVLLIAPVMGIIIQMAISRRREYLADATGSMMTRDPEGLARALEKLQNYGRPMKKQTSATANMFISNPLKTGILSRLFSTHPPLQHRIDTLRNNITKM